MTDLEKFRAWVQTYEGFPSEFLIDYTSEVADMGAIFPDGLVEVSRTEDILGNITILNQYNFSIYYTYLKNEGDDTTAKVNAEWVMDFQHWVQEQSARKLAPTFGNIDTGREKIAAQNGQYFDLPGSGVGQYYVLVNATFKKYIGV